MSEARVSVTKRGGYQGSFDPGEPTRLMQPQTVPVGQGQSETSLPGLRAFSQRTVHAIEALDVALTQENVTEAANACHWLMDELDDVRDALIGLMAKAGR